MDLHNLLDGDCGDSNPLMRVVSHVTQDRGLRDEGLNQQLRLPMPPLNLHSDAQVAQEFLNEIEGHALTSAPTTFRMDGLLREMQEIRSQEMKGPPLLGQPVAELATLEGYRWADDFNQNGQIWNTTHDFNAQNSAEGDAQSVQQFRFLPPVGTFIDNTMYSRFDDTVLPNTHVWMHPGGGYPVFDPLQAFGDTLPDNVEEVWSRNTVDQIFNLRASHVPDVIDEKTEDVEEKSEGRQEQEEEMWKRLQDEWEKLSEETDTWVSEYKESYDPYKEYSFQENNPLRDHPNPFKEGKKKKEAGDLCNAVLLFEAAVQKNPQHIEAWLYLGTSQAENEQDPSAIAALKNCLALDPSNLNAMMSLSISYTNESYERQACETLKDWLKSNPEYRYLVPKKNTSKIDKIKSHTSSFISSEMLEEVQQLFMEAACLHPVEPIDADVQCALGVLNNLSNQYERAAECFKAALHERPNDALLWNRLGATLANGSHSIEAVEAYHNALMLFPGYVRCRYNLGVTCVNLESYTQAAEHLVTALNIQASAHGVQGIEAKPTMSESIWSTLRMVTSLMDRRDLSEAVDERNLDLLKKELDIE